ncbi:MAG: methyltransferase [Pseudomonadota bacterium]
MPASLLRPTPRSIHGAQPLDRGTPPEEAALRLQQGGRWVVADRYATGLAVLARLEALLPAPGPRAGYPERRAHRQAFGRAAEGLLAPVEGGRVVLEGAPRIGFLRELYPDQASFALPIHELERLRRAWAAFQEGVHLAVLGYRVHPFWGTYVPARTAHLELFGTWLSLHGGPRGRAIDVGTGCGVLALMLAKAGFSPVLATDTNPNAVESVRRQLERMSPAPPIRPRHVDLLGDDPSPADLIVFNPPWTQGEAEGPLDGALLFEPGLFERFFDQAWARLAPDGRIALLFSNLMELVQPELPHPIRAELARGRFREVQTLRRKIKPTPGPDGHRRVTRERVEVWELART